MASRHARTHRNQVDPLTLDEQRKAAEPGRRSSSQRKAARYEFDDTAAAFPGDRLIHQLFEAQVKCTPNAVALVYESRSLTYVGLNRQANQLAAFLRRKGVGPDQRVGLYFEPSPERVVALLAILKAGGAYVPLDPAYPRERLAYLLKDSAPHLVLTQEALRKSLPGLRAEVIAVDTAWKAILREEDADPDPGAVGLTSHHLAYVIYTSGSTGEPKGVAAEHRSMVNRIAAQAHIAPFAPDDVCCHKTSIGFVDAVFEILGPLSYGRPVVLAPSSATADPLQLARLIHKERVTRLISVPSLARALIGSAEAVDNLQGVKGWTLSGEELRSDVLRSLRGALPHCRFVNLYGSSEVAADVTCHVIDHLEGEKVPIGTPIQNTRIYVLDERLSPKPVGEVGEIFVGGACLARGYLNRPELTAECFVPDPFDAGPQERMYRTGDLGCRRPDGTIEYRGRVDRQVKIRGVRIELGEIEAQLARDPEVREAAVLARDEREGERRLVAYLVPRDAARAPSPEALREYLLSGLPEYMVPGIFVTMEAFPLTPSGKLDRRALAAADLASSLSRPYEPPQGEAEETLAGIWRELLHLERVGRLDSFFELGGDSLLIVSLRQRLHQKGLSLEVREVFEHPRLADLAAALTDDDGVSVPANGIPPGCTRITPDMLPLIALQREDIDRIEQLVPGGAENIQDIYPLAPLQQGLLFHHLLGRDGDTYVISTLLSVTSRERLEEFIAALQWAVDRHDVLRTAVLWEGMPQPMQVVFREATLPVEQITLERDQDCVKQLKARLGSQQHHLDLRQAPLMRLEIAQDPHSAGWYALLYTHHLVSDEQSVEVLLSEVTAYLESRQLELPEPLSYRDHVFRTLNAASTQEAEKFFREKLSDVDEPTAPFGLLDVHGGGDIAEVRSGIEAELARRVRLEARKRGVSPATLFHAAWALVVSRTSALDDVVFGTVLLGRLHSATAAERSVGMFINTLPLRIPLQGLSTEDLINKTGHELAGLLDREQASLAEAQRCSGIEGSAPLFTALLNYRHTSGTASTGWAAAAGIETVATVERTNYPIVVSIDDQGEDFTVTAQTDRRVAPQRMLVYLQTALASLVEALECSPKIAALSLEVLPEEETRQVIEVFNDTEAPYPKDKLIHELFEEQVARTPEAVAVTYEGQSLTYAELNARANQLAHALLRRGVQSGEYIPILMGRSLMMVAAQIAVLKCGGAYVPLDATIPTERLSFLIEDCGAQRLLVEGAPQAGTAFPSAEWIDVSAELAEDLPTHNLGVATDALAPAYVMYTSGSTGKPKGVIVPHRAVNRLAINNCYARLGDGDCIPHCSNPAFDASTFEIWGALLNGAKLLIVPQSTVLDAPRLASLLLENCATALFLTVGLFNQYQDALAEVFGKLRYLLTGGDVVEPEIARRVIRRSPPGQLINAYGPTECTTFSTTFGITELTEDETSIPIGRPISNTTVYILNKYGQPVPIGTIGEMYIGGPGVALGYLNRPDLTTERFVPDPFAGHCNARMYRSGDLGRWRPDGTIEFLGRRDQQVKLRGFRIELGEIEAQLIRHCDVKEALVVAREDGPGGKRLVGYVVPRDPSSAPTAESLREHLRTVLPEYMVPSAFVTLDAFPLTPNGKLDRRALPVPDLSSYASQEYEPPQGEVEEVLAGIWQALLKVEQVGRNDNFFALGGHSLLIVQMMERLRRVGLSCEVRGVFEHPTLAALTQELTRGNGPDVEVPPNLIPADCEHITPRMLPLVSLTSEHIERIVQTVPGGAANIQDVYPLAPLQEGILFHHLLDQEGGDTYLLSTLLSVSSRQSLDELITALQAVIDRHDVLRTAVLWEHLPRPVQVVYRRASLPVEEVELDGVRDTQEQIREWLRPERQRMDLRQAPLMRLRVAADPHSGCWYVLQQLHHIVCDNVTAEAFSSEVVRHLTGEADRLPEAVAYRNHVAQALAYAQSHDAQAFFRGKLGDIDEPTAPFGLLDVQGDGSKIEEANEEVDPALAARLRSQARRRGVSAATLFHAAWALAVSRTSGRDDVVYGTVLLGRLQGSAGGQRVLGVFINTLPLRVSLQGLSAQTLVECTQRELVELLSHEQASLAEAQRCSGIGGTAPLFTSLLNYRHSAPQLEVQWGSDIGIEELGGYGRTNYPVTVSVDDLGEGFRLTAQTDPRIAPKRMLTYVQTALASLVDALDHSPETAALSLEVLPGQERRQVIEIFNATEAPYPKDKLIHELFEEQVVRTPEAVAVVYEGQSLTYAELNARANHLAWYLRVKGVGPDQLVGICLERSLEMVVGLLGILKAGGAYVPLDPSYPPERLAYMLEDAAPKTVLTQERLRGRLSSFRAGVIALDTEWSAISRQDSANLSARAMGVSSDNLAYVIYTSGSTGRPKGVMVEHRNVLLLWQGLEHLYNQADRCGRVALNAPINFDASVQQWTQLLSGRTMYMVPEDTRRDPERLLRFVEEHDIEGIDCTPSQLRSWVGGGLLNRKHFPLGTVLVGGEAVEEDLWHVLSRSDRIRFHNVYGPTECTVDTTATCLVGDESAPHIGRPMENRHVYLLGRQGEVVPIGVTGEIYIGGGGVARGYLNRSELTAERFVKHPFGIDRNTWLYKTGDLGRWRNDGTIEYLGRNDDQVKVRGFRIELGEIEAQLVRHCDVTEALVVAREDGPGGKRLVGYVVPRDPSSAPTAESLREHLKAVLPEYMVPGAFVTLNAFPLAPNGKRDRRALPAPDLSSYASQEYVPPQGEVEEVLAGIWQALLKLERVGRNDNFFCLGGHSLLIVQMMERLRRVGLSCEVRGVFDHPTLAALARELTQMAIGDVEVPPNLIPADCEHITPQMLPLVSLTSEHIERIVQTVPGGAANIQDVYPLAPLQEGILFHHLLDQEGGDTYLLSTLLSVSSRQRLDELITALQAVIDRHDVLRTAVLWEHLPRPVQVVYRGASLPVEEVELDGGWDADEQIREWLRPERQRMDLRQAPLMRLRVAADPHSGCWYVLQQLHHIVCDNVTAEAFSSEVVRHLAGKADRLPEAVPYRNHVAQALAYAQSHDAQAFFRGKLGDIDEPTAPFGLLDVQGDGSKIEEANEEVDPALAARLRAQARRRGVSAATLFHAAWALVVSRTSGRDDVVYGTVVLGRMQGSDGGQNILGVFINTLPLRVSLQSVSAQSLVERTQRELVELLSHEQASLAEAQRCSGIGGTAPLFTSLLNYRHSAPQLEVQWGSDIGIEELGGYGRTNYPVTVSVDDLGEGFRLTAQTDPRIAPKRMLAYVQTAVASLVEALEYSPETAALSLEVLPEQEWRQVIEIFNATEAPYPKDKLIHELFEEQVARTPDAVAVVYEGQSLTYAELNARANHLAWYLRVKGVGPDQLVGICLERSLEMVVGLLGILKAGGAYVPLDPSYPPERLAYMLEDAAPKTVLTQERLRGRLSSFRAGVIALDTEWSAISRQDSANLSARAMGVSSDNLAYVIYTSGSTGRPKGAMNEHQAVVNRLLWMQRQYQLGKQDRVLQKTPFSFDVSVWEFFWSLTAGACLAVARPGGHQDPAYLLDLVEDQKVTTLHFVPSMLRAFLEQHEVGHCQSIRHIVCSGEELSSDLQSRCLEALPHAQLSNLYGPTECAVDVTAWECRPGESCCVPIGRPISNTRIYVLNSQRNPVPIGAGGEIYIAGIQVGRGYLNRPELTAERFLVDPFSAAPKGRMYKTGDLGRWREDGTIEYLGRNDDQVKIRGFRIELGEIEIQLVQGSEVKEAVVVVRKEPSGDKRLVAYVLPKDLSSPPTAESLREHLKARFPEYMVPSAFVMVDSVPLTANGKLDRRALPEPDWSLFASCKYEQPQGKVEEILTEIWREILFVQRVGRHDNFFDLGGHSIAGVKIISAVREKLDIPLSVAAVFRYPTVKKMAEAIVACRQPIDENVELSDKAFEDGVIDLSAVARLN